MSTRAAQGREFTLLEIMIVVVLIGIVATIALPNLLEAEAHSEAAALQQDVEVIRKGWVQLLSQENVQITDAELGMQDSGLRSTSNLTINRSAPLSLKPFLTTLNHSSTTEVVLDLDAAGKPQFTYDANGKPVRFQTREAKISRLVGPRKILLQTFVVKATRIRLSGRFDLPEYSVEIRLSASSSEADELLRLSRRQFENEGYKVDYQQPGTKYGRMSLFFTP